MLPLVLYQVPDDLPAFAYCQRSARELSDKSHFADQDS